MKSTVKEKTDLSSTGNTPIKLLQWEKDFREILNAEENPVYSKIPGAITVGLDSSNKCVLLPTQLNVSEATTETRKCNQQRHILRKEHAADISSVSRDHNSKKHRLLAAETEKTVGLSTPEFQRLVLLEQLKLTRLQIEKEELQLKNLRQQENEAINTQKNDDPLVNSEFRLQDFLLLKLFLCFFQPISERFHLPMKLAATDKGREPVQNRVFGDIVLIVEILKDERHPFIWQGLTTHSNILKAQINVVVKICTIKTKKYLVY
ncbi:unnamed protein product [Acanthoscelides obtectus]|uniref:Uncharacterized protein n=1 Tax=Acanthoscelides obtectus TaxID=200917 RepID=A0A9P0KW11_ACAOB|nr:unnamed protein product [Acanthoscelides obtectus]CAK1645271.1 hypothetical protein AOBTE_LOCUS14070 [Acanthoscelides obtectus]